MAVPPAQVRRRGRHRRRVRCRVRPRRRGRRADAQPQEVPGKGREAQGTSSIKCRLINQPLK